MAYLNEDITQVSPPGWAEVGTRISLAAEATFPSSMSTDTSFTLNGPILVQIVDISNISISKYSQIQSLTEGAEAATDQLRGNTRGGSGGARRRVVQVQEDTVDATPPSFGSVANVHKLVVQDTAGNCAYAFELEHIHSSISAASPLGLKVLLLGKIEVQHGVLLLKKANIEILGGQILNLNASTLLSQLQADLQPTPPTE